MALSVIQTKVSTRQSGAGSYGNAFTSGVTGGSLLIAHTAMFNSSGTGESVVSDATNGSWGTAADTGYFIGGDADSEIQLNAFPNSGAASITVTTNPPGASADIDLSLLEIGGAATSTPRDVAVTAGPTNWAGTGGATTAVATGTLAQAAEIVISSFSHTRDNRTLTEDTGDSFTNADENESNSSGQTFLVQYKIVAATTSVTVNGAIGAGIDGSGDWFTGVASYKEAAAAPAGDIPIFMRHYLRMMGAG